MKVLQEKNKERVTLENVFELADEKEESQDEAEEEAEDEGVEEEYDEEDGEAELREDEGADNML